MVPYGLKCPLFREEHVNQERSNASHAGQHIALYLGVALCVKTDGRVGRWRLSKFALVSGLGIGGIIGFNDFLY